MVKEKAGDSFFIPPVRITLAVLQSSNMYLFYADIVGQRLHVTFFLLHFRLSPYFIFSQLTVANEKSKNLNVLSMF